MGQQPPGTTGPRHIGKGIEDFALGVFLWLSARFGCWHIGFNQRPFAVCEIGRVRLSRFHTPQSTLSPFPWGLF